MLHLSNFFHATNKVGEIAVVTINEVVVEPIYSFHCRYCKSWNSFTLYGPIHQWICTDSLDFLITNLYTQILQNLYFKPSEENLAVNFLIFHKTEAANWKKKNIPCWLISEAIPTGELVDLSLLHLIFWWYIKGSGF